MDDGLGSDVSPDNFEGNVAAEVAFGRATGDVKLGWVRERLILWNV